MLPVIGFICMRMNIETIDLIHDVFISLDRLLKVQKVIRKSISRVILFFVCITHPVYVFEYLGGIFIILSSISCRNFFLLCVLVTNFGFQWSTCFISMKVPKVIKVNHPSKIKIIISFSYFIRCLCTRSLACYSLRSYADHDRKTDH